MTKSFTFWKSHMFCVFLYLKIFGDVDHFFFFFKVFVEVVTIWLLFHVLVLWPWGMWDLSCQGDQTLPPTLESKVLTTGPPGKFLPTASSCLPHSLPATGNLCSDFHGKTSLIFFFIVLPSKYNAVLKS